MIPKGQDFVITIKYVHNLNHVQIRKEQSRHNTRECKYRRGDMTSRDGDFQSGFEKGVRRG